jgi:prepilin-type N-terminal cleavage/methylation domain-containing protein
MMISVAKINGLRNGFSLLEIIISVGIVSMIGAGATAMLIFLDEKDDAQKISSEIELLAKRTRYKCFKNHENDQIKMNKLGIYPVNPDHNDQKNVNEINYEERIKVPNHIKVYVKYWNTAKWVSIDKNEVVWKFDGNGMCEPISVKFDDGKNVTIDQYQTLTANRETFHEDSK